MSKSVIQSGICGFTTEVVARADSRTCSLIITSDCPAIKGLAEELRQVDPMEEIYFIMSGEGEMTVGEDSRPVVAGDAIWIPAGSAHSLLNTGQNDCFILVVASPAW